jgi:hypothetical protein
MSTARGPSNRSYPPKFVAEQAPDLDRVPWSADGARRLSSPHAPSVPTRVRAGPRIEAPPLSSRGQDLNLRPLGYEPSELPDCSTPHPQDSDARMR